MNIHNGRTQTTPISSRFARLLAPAFALGIALCVVSLAAALGGCSQNAATGRSQLLSMSSEEEIALGTEAQPELTKEFGGKVDSQAAQRYVVDIGHRLSQQTEADNPTLPWEFTLLDSKVINAFALPGGKVFISRGLAEAMTNEAQLAAVLGHEIGHVTARHSNERFAQSAATSIGGAIIGGLIGAAASDRDGAIAAGAAAGATVGQVVSLSYSRDQEVEADRLGMRYMSRIGYDPTGAIEVQEILAKAGGGKGNSIDFLSTHPSSERRISELKKRFDKYYRHTVNNPQFGKFPERYQAQMLQPLKHLPQARHQAMTNDQIHRLAQHPHLRALAELRDPRQWCAHCREDAANVESKTAPDQP